MIPEQFRDKIKPERIPTPLADALEARLAFVVNRMEREQPDGWRLTCTRLARAIVTTRQAECTLLGIDKGETPQRVAIAQRIVRRVRQGLDSADNLWLMRMAAQVGQHRGRA